MLKNKVALITGGSRGIGKEICKTFAKNGCNIAFFYVHNEKSANDSIKEIEQYGVNVKAYKCDVSKYNDVKDITKQILEDFKDLDILVNNAGIVRDNLLLKTSEEDFDNVIDINLKGVFNTTKHLYRHFMKRKKGKIINLSSVVGLSGNAGQVNYASSKAGIIGLTKSLAKELGSRGINCNAIAPGYIFTDMTENFNDIMKDNILNVTALKRFGTAKEVADLALFLASDMSNFITGEVIKVDGGLYI